MTRDEIRKVRDALGVFEPFERKHANLIEALDILDRELAKPEPEPVAWQERAIIGRISDGPTYRWSAWYPCSYNTEQVNAAKIRMREREGIAEYDWRPLYTAPPSREWQSLTDDEIDQCIDAAGRSYHRHKRTAGGQQLSPADAFDSHLAWAVQQALRAKNTGEQA